MGSEGPNPKFVVHMFDDNKRQSDRADLRAWIRGTGKWSYSPKKKIPANEV